MTDPATPGQEGPSYGPPPLPQGWIAQWDGSSKKYWFVQLSTGASQWETPTQAAPTVGTPTPTPGQETSPFPQPGEQRGGQDGERGFTSMAMNQLLHSQAGGHSGKPSNPLLGIAGQLLGSGNHNQAHQQTSNAGGAGIVGVLAESLLGGKTKPNQGPQQSYSGQTQQGAYGQHHEGFMGKIGGAFGGASSGHQNNFGYSESGQHQGGYTGQAPPISYQPAGNPNTQGNTGPAPASSYQALGSSNSQGYAGASSASSYQGTGNQSAQGTGAYYSSQQSSYNHNPQGSPQSGTAPYFNSQQQPYPPNSQSSTNSGPNQYYNQQQSQPQPMYGTPQSQQQQQQHSQPQLMYGASQPQQQQQPGYGGPLQQQQQQQQQQQYGTGQQDPYSPIYVGPANGNLPQPQHHMFQGFHNPSHQGGLYGDQGGPPHPPMGSHPNHGQGYQPPPGQGSPNEMSGYGRGRW